MQRLKVCHFMRSPLTWVCRGCRLLPRKPETPCRRLRRFGDILSGGIVEVISDSTQGDAGHGEREDDERGDARAPAGGGAASAVGRDAGGHDDGSHGFVSIRSAMAGSPSYEEKSVTTVPSTLVTG